MIWLSKIAFAWKSLFSKKRLDAQLSDEIRLHLEMETDAKIAAGLAPEEASYAALREFGNVAGIQERTREERGWIWPEQLARDVRLAVRSLLRARAFTFTVLLILALCLGANVVIFALVNGVLLRPLPFHDPDRLVTVFNCYPKAGLEHAGSSVPHYLERRREITAFADAALLRFEAVSLNRGTTPERIEAARVTPSFFRLLGVNAALGRTFDDGEGEVGKDRVVLLDDRLWREHFSADPAVIGTTVRLNDKPCLIIGVLPPGFRFLSQKAGLWMPLSFTADDRSDEQRHGWGGEMIARLRPGVAVAAAQAQVDALNARMLKTDPSAKTMVEIGFHTLVRDLQSDRVAGLRPALLLLQTGALVLLVIGAVNLANLFMVRATSRIKEYSLHQVLGANRCQLVRKLVVEGLLLSLSGGLLGLGLGAAALRGMAVLTADRLPISVAPGPDISVCLAGLGLAGLLGLLLALPTGWFLTRGSPATTLSVASRGSTTTRPVLRLRHGLIVAQIALAFVLLSGAGLLGLSFLRLLRVPPGFQPDSRLTGAVTLPMEQYPEPGARVALIGRLLAGLRSSPGVASAAISTGVPFSGRSPRFARVIVGETGAADEFIQEALFNCWISGDYFSTLGVPLRAGRFLTDEDGQRGTKACVVDEEFARRHWPQGGALGRQIALPDDPQQPDAARDVYSIVGVVGAVKQDDLAAQGAHGAVYFPVTAKCRDLLGFAAPAEFMVTIRSPLAPESVGPALGAIVRRLDPGLLLYEVKPMAARVDESLADRRTPLLLAGLFAGLSLLLATVGIYGVLAYSVAQQRREIGVRLALGARPEQILRQFLGLGFRLLAVGLPLGLVGAWWAGQAMAGLLFGVAPTNPGVFGSTALALTAVALLACLLPARRAAQVSPIEAIRCE